MGRIEYRRTRSRGSSRLVAGGGQRAAATACTPHPERHSSSPRSRCFFPSCRGENAGTRADHGACRAARRACGSSGRPMEPACPAVACACTRCRETPDSTRARPALRPVTAPQSGQPASGRFRTCGQLQVKSAGHAPVVYEASRLRPQVRAETMLDRPCSSPQVQDGRPVQGQVVGDQGSVAAGRFLLCT